MDAKEEFIASYVYPSIKANGMYEGKYPLATALGRPLIATKLVEVAEKEGAYAVAHGCTGKGNDQVRMDVTVRSLNPSLKVIAPVREWNMSRDKEIVYAKKHGITIKPSNSIFSIDQNLWGRSIESGPLEDPRHGAAHRAPSSGSPRRGRAGRPRLPRDRLRRGGTRLGQRAETGRPRAHPAGQRVRGEARLGIVDHIEDRLVGIKSREVYECPGRPRDNRGAQGPGAAGPHAERARVQGSGRAGVVVARLLGALDGAAALRPGQLHRDDPAEGLREGQAQVPQGRDEGRGEVVAELALPAEALDLLQRSRPSTRTRRSGFIELWGLQSRTAANAIANRRAPAGGQDVSNILRGSRVKRSSKKANDFTSSVGFDGPLSRHVVAINMAHMLSLLRSGEVGKEEGAACLRLPRQAPRPDEGGPLDGGRPPLAGAEGDRLDRDGRGRLPEPRKEQERPGRHRPAHGDAGAGPALLREAKGLQASLLRVMARYGQLPLPGYTHLQRAQPTTVFHHMQSHFEAVSEDAERLEQLYGRVNLSPMGAAAFAGTSVEGGPGVSRVAAGVRWAGQQARCSRCPRGASYWRRSRSSRSSWWT